MIGISFTSANCDAGQTYTKSFEAYIEGDTVDIAVTSYRISGTVNDAATDIVLDKTCYSHLEERPSWYETSGNLSDDNIRLFVGGNKEVQLELPKMTNYNAYAEESGH